jgi:hypothetical protein
MILNAEIRQTKERKRNNTGNHRAVPRMMSQVNEVLEA